MRHGTKINHLGRKSAHRKAMLSNLASQLIQYKRINTTVAKAKALRRYVEPLLTKSKNDTTHSRRMVFRYLQNKFAVQELFGEVAAKIADRPGGYTRILRTGTRLGDNAEMCIIELVDFNDNYSQAKEQKTTKKKRRRRGSSKSKDVVEQVKDTAQSSAESAGDAVAEAAEDVQESAGSVAEAVEEKVADVAENVEEVVEATADKAEEAVEAAKEKAGEVAEAAEEKAEEVAEAVKEKSEEVAEAVEEKVEEVADAAEEATEGDAEDGAEEKDNADDKEGKA